MLRQAWLLILPVALLQAQTAVEPRDLLRHLAVARIAGSGEDSIQARPPTQPATFVAPAGTRAYGFVSNPLPPYNILPTADGGESWQSHSVPVPGTLWVDPNGWGAIVIGEPVSRDRGVTWSPMNLPPRGKLLATVPGGIMR
jgi:hypothetical protein